MTYLSRIILLIGAMNKLQDYGNNCQFENCKILLFLLSFQTDTLIMSLRRAKNANDIFKDAVFGFTREHEKKERIMVPAMIKYLVLTYYLLDESFASDDSARIKLTEENTVAEAQQYTKKYGKYGDRQFGCLLRGMFQIGDSMNDISECKWTLRFKQQPINVKIGLMQDSWHSDSVHFGAELAHRAMSIVNGQSPWDVNRDPLPWNHGATKEYVVQMCLNIKRKELLFYANGVLVIQLKKSYYFMDQWDLQTCRLGIELNESTNYVKLVEFSTKH